MSQHKPDKAKAILLWTLGLSASAIAERLGRKPDTVRDWITKAGVRKPGDPPRTRYDSTGGSSGRRARARLSP